MYLPLNAMGQRDCLSQLSTTRHGTKAMGQRGCLSLLSSSALLSKAAEPEVRTSGEIH